ncbi:MAG: hypothetical protein AOA66_0556 [Candidatus Bathyarchaeota archaeon BA2]|nr:MAG: hypothetical protein AOA66_0556 [Candidatus Bathyarchaeota archaeon BA2]
MLPLVALLVADIFLLSCTPVQANPGTDTKTYVIEASKDDAWCKVNDVKWDDASYYLSKFDRELVADGASIFQKEPLLNTHITSVKPKAHRAEPQNVEYKYLTKILVMILTLTFGTGQ